MHQNNKTIIVGMSGGVDSSVVALLLKKQGYNVIGAFMKNWSDPLPGGEQCSWRKDRFDARRVAVKLDIPLITLDFEKEYKEKVFHAFLDEYKAGRTPNPDILCNKEIKFRAFLERARELGADAIATGHYARVTHNQDGTFSLLKGKDPKKDQSYFLHTLGQSELKHTLFPIGDLTKDTVRDIARRNNLPTAERKDSQGICFVGNVELRDFLKQYIPEEKGKVVTADGKVLGSHNGQAFYTIGQRHGLSIGAGIPMYISKRDAHTNTVTVAEGRNNPRIFDAALEVHKTAWVSGKAPKAPFSCSAKIRYRQPDQKVTGVIKSKTGFGVTFAEKQRAVTPGQSIVFYDGDRVLGGGIIDEH